MNGDLIRLIENEKPTQSFISKDHQTRVDPERPRATTMLLTYKTRVFPTQDQKKVLWELAERCRLLYNFALAERKLIWVQESQFQKEYRKFLSYTDQQNALPQLKQRYPEYAWVYSKIRVV